MIRTSTTRITRTVTGSFEIFETATAWVLLMIEVYLARVYSGLWPLWYLHLTLWPPKV